MNPLTSPFVLIPAVGIALFITAIVLMVRDRYNGLRIRGWQTNMLTASVVAVLCTIALGPLYAYAVVPTEAVDSKTVPIVKVGDTYVGDGIDGSKDQVTYFIEDVKGSVVPQSAEADRVRVTDATGATATIEISATVKPATWLWPFEMPAPDEYTISLPTAAE
ncbi:hypothetical protein [Microbacterium sp. 77mftsu3.1]|uniref:hypothetical protein n=1 Tax=Microbacterium sp. 77mftsu3.1 TaxID=1761802 RepID=UPI000381EE38|nr:hypothetical protein [Microbacterium sp. 77mftsu3.1]SDH55489.1 hypothetical protein SAMN04488590_3563 [Microbacterium sp. 77mftsu3.1]